MSIIPDDLRYTKNHEWVRMGEYYIGTCGITDYSQERLGDIIFLELPETNYEVKQGERIGFIESSQDQIHINSPLRGEIIEVNMALLEEPLRINHGPYEDGWIFKLDVKISFEFKELMTAEEYADYVQYGF